MISKRILLLFFVQLIGMTVIGDAQTVAIVGVNVIPMYQDQQLPDQTVIVRNGIIAQIGDVSHVKIPACALKIDGKGKFLIPGLVDMHVHLTLATKQVLPLLVANGVTTVRDVGGDLQTVDRWRDEIESGRLIGPNIFRSGPYVDGAKDVPDRLVIATENDATAAVNRLKALGVDFIKIHNAVPRDAYFLLLRKARSTGIKVVGHVPLTVTPEEAIKSGQTGIEHMTSLIEGRVVSAAMEKKTPVEALASFDDVAAGSLFEQMSKRGVWMTPNLVAEQAITYRAEIEQTPDPRAKYVAASLKKYWYQAFTGKPTAARKLLLNRYFDLVRMMKAKKVRLLAGTDLGLRDVYPGFSLHDELELFVKAGLTPFEAIRTATVNPALFFGDGTGLGSIAEKQRADMVLLSADPTVDIRNTRKIEGVILRGRYFSKSELEQMLEDAVTAAESN